MCHRGDKNMDVHFKKPIAVVDLETTGLDIAIAKIVSVGIVILDCDGSIKYRNELRVNPGMGVPESRRARFAE